MFTHKANRRFRAKAGGRPRLYRASALLSAFLLVAGTAGCGSAAKTAVKAPPVPVATDRIELTDLPTADSFLGSVTPYIQTVLSPALSGILDAVHVRVGDVVHQGETLASIDTSLLQAQKGQAAASTDVAQAQLGATSQGTDNSLTQAAAVLKTAETNLDNAKASANSTVAEGQQGVVAAQQGVVAAQEGVTAAEKALTTSQAQLANVQVQYGNSVKQAQAGLTQAQATLAAANVQAQTAANSLAGAQAAYDTAKTGLQRAEQMAHSPSDPNLLAAQATYDQANINLQNVQSAVANANAGVTKAQSDVGAAQEALQAAQNGKTVQTAQAQVAEAESGVKAAQIKVSQAQNQVSAAQAALQNAQTTGNNGVAAAEATLQQQQTAYQTLLSNPQLQVNAAQVQAAQAGVQVIQAQINDGNVIAPVSGYVTAVNAQVGQAVGPQGGFITIASMTPLQATVDVPENLIGKMKPGLAMSVFVSATGETLNGSVSAVHPAPDPTNKEYGVDITLQPGQQQLLPGMQVEAHLTKTGQKGIVVPADSLVTMQSGALSVFLVVNGKAKQQMVRVGAMTGSVYQITSGLKPGDVVIVKGQNLVSDGDRVQTENSSPTTVGKQGTKSSPGKAGGGKSTGK